jgi:tetratricopeptide (TPR) repeat protein
MNETPVLSKRAVPDGTAPAGGAAKAVAVILALALLTFGGWYRWVRPSALEKGRRALDRGDADGAVEILVKKLEGAHRFEEETDLRKELSRAYLMKGAFENAERELRSILEKDPDDAYANLTLGFLFFSRGQDAFAAEFLRKAKALAPADLRASHALASLFNSRGDHDLARDEALDILNKAPTDAAARMELGRAEMGRGLFSDAAQAFETVLQANPTDGGARQMLAQARLSEGDLQGAEEALAAILKQSPEDASALSLQAEYFLARSRPEDAESLYQRIYEKDGRRLFAGVALARSLARRRDTDKAEAMLLDISQHLPRLEDVPPPPYSTFYEPWDTMEMRRSIRRLRVAFNLAMEEFYRAKYLMPDAERQVRLALQMESRNVEALRTLTDLKRVSGDAKEWLRAADDAAKLFPAHPAVLLDKAQALLAAKKPQEALTFAQGAAMTCPSLARAQAVLAESQLALGEREPARKTVEKALELNPSEADAFLVLGLIKAKIGDWKGADEAFARAAEMDGASARARWERALVLEKLGRKRDAAALKEEALALEPHVYAGRK